MGTSQPARGAAGPVVSEHAASRPATGLRPYIAGYTGYRQAAPGLLVPG